MRSHARTIRKRSKAENWTNKESLALVVYNNHVNGDWKRQSYYKPDNTELAHAALYEWHHDTEVNFNRAMSGSMRDISLKNCFNDNPIPTLIIESLWDLTWGLDKAMILHKNHPNAHMEVFTHSGHSPFSDEPEKFHHLKFFRFIRKRRMPTMLEVPTDDPFILVAISEKEQQKLNFFKAQIESIKKGVVYFDQSSPLNCYLSYLSCAQSLDVQKAKKLQDRNWTTVDMEEERYWFNNTKIWRIPAKPEKPEPGQIWPIYVKDIETDKWTDTLLFIYWKGKWYRWGNMGGPFYDWRQNEERLSKQFIIDKVS